MTNWTHRRGRCSHPPGGNEAGPGLTARGREAVERGRDAAKPGRGSAGRATHAARRAHHAPLLAAAISAALTLLVAATPALARTKVNEEFKPFAQCPIATHGVRYCVVADTTSGEFKVGSKTVTINKTITLQGGLTEASNQLVSAANGETLSKTPLTLPGGLVGIELGSLTEVTATTELTGPVLINEGNIADGNGPAVIMPIRVKLENPALGNECYIGSQAEPITLELTTGTTNPPPPNKPITGKPGTLTLNSEDTIFTVSNNSLVDNSFAAPGVGGCGESLAPVIDPVVDVDAGLPAAAGTNTAILNGTVYETTAKAVKKSHVIKSSTGKG
jgi:hypothetical protein